MFFFIFFYLLFIFENMSFCDNNNQDLQQRVQELEAQVRALTEEVIQLKETVHVQQKVTEHLSKGSFRQETLYDECIASFKKENQHGLLYNFYHHLIHSQVWIGGYLDGGFSDRKNDKFFLSRVGLTLRSSWHDLFGAEIEVMYNEEEFKIVQASFLVNLFSWGSIKLGILPVPIGNYNENFSSPSNSLSSIPWNSEYLVPVVWSVPGISIFGKWPEEKNYYITYNFLLSNGFGKDAFLQNEGNKKGNKNFDENDFHSFQGAGRIGFVMSVPEISSWSLGLSGLIGEYDNSKQYEAVAVDFFVRWGPFPWITDRDYFSISGEYMIWHAECNAIDIERLSGIQGHYLQFEYCFLPETWKSWAKEWGISFQYDWLKMKSDHWQHSERYTIGIHFRPWEESIFRLEYSWVVKKLERDYSGFIISFATYF
ncbi:MAG: hypothetical protein KBC30_02255 [Planctomycetes bacterium]|jgi:hypothetical protein|nr:hypothetical protein [Planctomycetota bacterium]HPY74763.1 hypothetical protein [Planctomycetota bacterium]HQB00404.1 hypothetical protein [Planctomycetota bacterium]